MPFVTRNAHRTYFEIGGRADGPTLVMIRGLSRSSRYWLEVRPLLEAHLRVIVLDNRGVGRSDAPGPGFSVSDMGDDVAAVMDAAGIGRAHVFGISLGGMVAMRFALRHAPRVDRLVLGATTAGGGALPVPVEVALTLLSTARLGVAETIRRTAPLTLSPRALRERPDIIERWVALAESEPRHRGALVGQLVAAAMHDARAELGRITAPTLVLTGDADTLIDPAESRALAAAIPRARLEILPGAGHDFPTEAPAETAGALLRFLS